MIHSSECRFSLNGLVTSSILIHDLSSFVIQTLLAVSSGSDAKQMIPNLVFYISSVYFSSFHSKTSIKNDQRRELFKATHSLCAMHVKGILLKNF